MRCLTSSVRSGAGCAALILPLVLAGSVLAGGKQEKIQFSDPAAPITISNLNRLEPDKSFSKQIEEDLFKPFQSMKEGNSLDPVMPPVRSPNPQSAPNKRQRELIDQRKNWAFIDSADLLPQANVDDMLHVKEYGPDGKEKQSLGAIDKYYENLGKRHGLSAIEMSQQPGAGQNRDFAGTNILNRANFAFITNEQAWTTFATDNGSASLPPWAASAAPPTTEQIRAQQQHRADFSSLLDGRVTAPIAAPSPFANPAAFPGSSPAVPGADFGNFGNTAPPTAPVNPLAPTEYHSPASPVLGAAAQAANVRPHVLDDPTLRALGLPQPQFKLVETPKPAPPTIERASEFSLPQRKF